MKILIFGGSGLLGSQFVDFMSSEYEVFSTSNKLIPGQLPFNATNLEEVKNLFDQIKPDVVINCIGLTNIETCQKNPNLSYALNYLFPKYLSDYCLKFGINLVHISTDHFSSQDLIPRSEDCSYFVVNNYAQHKMEADKYISTVNPNSLVIRTNFFRNSSNHHNSSLNWYLTSFKFHERFYGFQDVFFTPISAIELVKNIHILMLNRSTGIYNIVGSECISKYNFAQKIADVIRVPRNTIIPGSIELESDLVERSNYLCLSNHKVLEIPGVKILSLDQMLSNELSEFNG